MSAHFKAFLDQTYIDPEPITTTLNRFNWYDLLSTRINYIIESSNPDYQMVTLSLTQAINDKLRIYPDKEEKREIVNDLGKLFRNLLAHLCEHKIGFSNTLPEIIKSIRKLYEINGDNFDELEELLGFERFTQNIESAMSKINKTICLKWYHQTASLEDLSNCFILYGLITPCSKIEDLFTPIEIKNIKIPSKSRKRFSLVMCKLFDERIIRPVGGKSTYGFIEKHVLVSGGKLKPFSKGYMRRTISATNKNSMVGFGIHEKIVDEIINDINRKNRQ